MIRGVDVSNLQVGEDRLIERRVQGREPGDSWERSRWQFVRAHCLRMLLTLWMTPSSLTVTRSLTPAVSSRASMCRVEVPVGTPMS